MVNRHRLPRGSKECGLPTTDSDVSASKLWPPSSQLSPSSRTDITDAKSETTCEERGAAAAVEQAFSCRRWYRLTGKSIKAEDELTRIAPAVRLTSTAPARPPTNRTRGWTSKASQAFTPVLPCNGTLQKARPSTHRSSPAVMSPTSKCSSTWREIGQWDPTSMKQLVNKVYSSSRSLSVKKRKEQEKKALKDHIYLPAVHKTLTMFHSPRANSFEIQKQHYGRCSHQESAIPSARTLAAIPIGSNLLSSQLHLLRQELALQTLSGAAEPNGETSHLGETSMWSPHPPPRSAPAASYRSARYPHSQRTDCPTEALATNGDAETPQSSVGTLASQGSFSNESSSSTACLSYEDDDLTLLRAFEDPVHDILQRSDAAAHTDAASDEIVLTCPPGEAIASELPQGINYEADFDDGEDGEDLESYESGEED